jgi:hypothetical protein
MMTPPGSGSGSGTLHNSSGLLKAVTTATRESVIVDPRGIASTPLSSRPSERSSREPGSIVQHLSLVHESRLSLRSAGMTAAFSCYI